MTAQKPGDTDSAKKEVKKPPKKPFEVYKIQLSNLSIKAMSEGAILEALGDDIESMKTGELNSKLPNPHNNESEYMNYMDDL